MTESIRTDAASPRRGRAWGGPFTAMAAFACLLVAACGGTTASTASTPAPQGAANPSSPVTITFWSYNYGTAGAGGKGIQDLLDGFARRYPNIHVEPKNVSNVLMNAQVQAAAAAGQPPDVAQMALSSAGLVAASMPYTPIDSISPRAEYQAAVDAYVPSTRSLGLYDGKRVEMPFNLSTPTLIYNADLFRRAGLDPVHPPAAWSDVQSAALQIKRATGADGVYVANTGSFDWMTQSVINSNGGYTIHVHGKKVDVGFARKPAVEALEMLQTLNRSGAMPNYGTTGSVSNTPDLEAFATGRLGMYLQSTVAVPQIVKGAQGKFQVMTAAEPSFGGAPVHPVNSGAGLVTFTKDRARQQAVWTLIQYLTSHDAFEIVSKEMGYLPLRSDVVSDPSILQSAPLLKPTLDQLPHLTPWVAWPGRQSAQAMTVFQNAVQSVEFDAAPAQATMQGAADRVSAMLRS